MISVSTYFQRKRGLVSVFLFKRFDQTKTSILVSNLPRYLTYHAFCVFSVYVKIRAASSHDTNRFILHIFSIQSDSFCVFSVYKQIHSVHSVRRSTLFPIFSVQVQIPQGILSLWTDLFRVFLVYIQFCAVYSANAPK